ncbi:MAG: hypothetical protein JST51_08540 [Armatimonadetes bacterium]|nr:hypothetical protein [Armatimonadota bacterium]
MKLLLPVAGLALFGVGFAGGGSTDVTVIISGGARGHLSPCGCTSPMSGGLKRLATIVRAAKTRGSVVWIDTGDIIDEPGRQSQLKVETYAELMGDLGVDAVAYTRRDRQQGAGLLASGSPLSGTKWLTPLPGPDEPTMDEKAIHGLRVTTADNQSVDFGAEKDSDILVFDGPAGQLDQIKKSHQLEVFASEGIPTVNGAKVSPGSNLRGVVVATFRDGRFVSAKVETLEASIPNDPKADKIYSYYLKRVTDERLIDKVPRDKDDDYAGSKNCRSCHGVVYHQYLTTRHAGAYKSLEHEGHQADPDCVGCHVVGLDSTKGFFYQQTPALAQVGCESCHGAGREHARNPRAVHLPKVTEQKCLSCHTPSNSPKFNFQLYWKKIKH